MQDTNHRLVSRIPLEISWLSWRSWRSWLSARLPEAARASYTRSNRGFAACWSAAIISLAQRTVYQYHQSMLALLRISNCILTSQSEDVLPLPSKSPSKSRFESLPTELRLQIYSLLLNGRPEYCHFKKCEIGRRYSTPRLYPAILAVNRSISAEAYHILYGENTFLFLGTTRIAEDLDVRCQSLSRRAGLPRFQRPSLLPEQSRHLIKHVAAAPLELARND